jgi:putative glutamine amidotransferase
MIPLIGITVDNKDNTVDSGTYESALRYSRAVAEAGGLPVLLAQEVALAGRYVSLCDGLILTGGADPVTEAFGEPTDARARRIDPLRQQFELALLDAAGARGDKPVLGVCLGMQLMALHAGGKLNQYLPDTLANAAIHQDNHRHGIVMVCGDSRPARAAKQNPDEQVVSCHRQAVASAGTLRVVATAQDGTIEAIDDPQRNFYLGVQWHPERGEDSPLNRGLIAALVDEARKAATAKGCPPRQP